MHHDKTVSNHCKLLSIKSDPLTNNVQVYLLTFVPGRTSYHFLPESQSSHKCRLDTACQMLVKTYKQMTGWSAGVQLCVITSFMDKFAWRIHNFERQSNGGESLIKEYLPFFVQICLLVDVLRPTPTKPLIMIVLLCLQSMLFGS